MKICEDEGCRAAIPNRKRFCPDCAHNRKVENTKKSREGKKRDRRDCFERREPDYGMTSKTEYFTEERKKKLKEDGSYFLPENDYSCVQE